MRTLIILLILSSCSSETEKAQKKLIETQAKRIEYLTNYNDTFQMQFDTLSKYCKKSLRLAMLIQKQNDSLRKVIKRKSK